MQAFAISPIFRSQNVSSTAVALSGVSQLELQQHDLDSLYLTTDTASIRYRIDGGSPTATVGHELPTGGVPLRLNGRQNILALRFIGKDSAAAVVMFSLTNSRNAGGIS